MRSAPNVSRKTGDRGRAGLVQSRRCAAPMREMSSGVMRGARAHFAWQVRITPSGRAGLAAAPAVDTRHQQVGAATVRRPLRNTLKTIVNRVPCASFAGRRAEFPAFRNEWHVGCIPDGDGNVSCGEPCNFFQQFRVHAAVQTSGSAYRRPPVWRAVVRPARYFFIWTALFIWPKVAWRPKWGSVLSDWGCVFASKKRGFCSLRRTLLPRQGGEAPHHRHESVEINRLGDVEVEAGFDGGGDVAFGSVAGHRDGQHMPACFQGP